MISKISNLQRGIYLKGQVTQTLKNIHILIKLDWRIIFIILNACFITDTVFHLSKQDIRAI